MTNYFKKQSKNKLILRALYTSPHDPLRVAQKIHKIQIFISTDFHTYSRLFCVKHNINDYKVIFFFESSIDFDSKNGQTV